jgi:PAS domain S-box-containing protein
MLTVEQQEQLLDRAGVLVVVLSLDGRIVHFNRRCEDVTGYAAAELEGRKIWDVLLMPDEVETYQRIYTRLRNSALPDGYDTGGACATARRSSSAGPIRVSTTATVTRPS